MYDANSPLLLRDDNMYAGGDLRQYDDNTADLTKRLPTYQTGPTDRFHPELLPTDTLDALAYQYWKNEVADAERLWWVLAWVNDLDAPFDLTPYLGRRLLVPDIIAFKLQAAAA